MKDTNAVRLESSLYKKVKEHSEKEGRTLTWVLSKAVEQYLMSEKTKG